MTNQVSYGANIGWMNWRADTTNGAVIGEFVCSGTIYGANVGWINLGSGTPTNGLWYSNTSSNDFGVNNYGDGRLRGYAYGANIGWINFDPTGNARIDLVTGKFSGYAYGANIGWISLSNAQAVVKTDTIRAGADSDSDGMTDAWERHYAGDITTLSAGGHDADGDGVLDTDEYGADTNPFDIGDYLRITALDATLGDTATITWTSKPSRLYRVQKRLDLLTGVWGDSDPPGLVSPDGGLTTTRSVTDSVVTQRFFRVQSLKPLSP